MGFNFDINTGILVYKTNGLIDKKHIMEFYIHLAAKSSYPRKLKTLIDATECQFEFEIRDLNELFLELEIAFAKYDSIREAIVVAEPYETVIATLFSDGFIDPNYEFKVFSTESAARKWLMNW